LPAVAAEFSSHFYGNVVIHNNREINGSRFHLEPPWEMVDTSSNLSWFSNLSIFINCPTSTLDRSTSVALGVQDVKKPLEIMLKWFFYDLV